MIGASGCCDPAGAAGAFDWAAGGGGVLRRAITADWASSSLSLSLSLFLTGTWVFFLFLLVSSLTCSYTSFLCHSLSWFLSFCSFLLYRSTAWVKWSQTNTPNHFPAPPWISGRRTVSPLRSCVAQGAYCSFVLWTKIGNLLASYLSGGHKLSLNLSNSSPLSHDHNSPSSLNNARTPGSFSLFTSLFLPLSLTLPFLISVSISSHNHGRNVPPSSHYVHNFFLFSHFLKVFLSIMIMICYIIGSLTPELDVMIGPCILGDGSLSHSRIKSLGFFLVSILLQC